MATHRTSVPLLNTYPSIIARFAKEVATNSHGVCTLFFGLTIILAYWTFEFASFPLEFSFPSIHIAQGYHHLKPSPLTSSFHRDVYEFLHRTLLTYNSIVSTHFEPSCPISNTPSSIRLLIVCCSLFHSFLLAFD